MVSEKAPGQSYDDDDENAFEYNAFDDAEEQISSESSFGNQSSGSLSISPHSHITSPPSSSAKSAGVIPPPPISLSLNQMHQFGLSTGTGPVPTVPSTRPSPFGGKAPGSGKTGGTLPQSVMSSYMLIPPHEAAQADGSASQGANAPLSALASAPGQMTSSLSSPSSSASSSSSASASSSSLQVSAPVPPSLPPPRPDVPLGFSITPSANTVTLSHFDLLAVVGMGSFGKVCRD
eukprot:MONOS_7395.1-p1 / transcript=MONOS_7395.1 / gene=MONOS_7395 / organism=Monocercomonoides_exilis_PA203 / gene_product=unspecified product / transcript_product=unspecified product / location=Mono_scaffold00251:56799-57848(+) / protein_length=234 / sequence_SO=supercontig / SO=protein_coding / is_pseudo=false